MMSIQPTKDILTFMIHYNNGKSSIYIYIIYILLCVFIYLYGYTYFNANLLYRHIFISCKEVGLSQQFHNDKCILSYCNVLKPNSTHESFHSMTTHCKSWIVENMKFVALQLFDVVGNVVIFCNHGRSRSPMYVVAYLIIFHDLSVDAAMTHLSVLLEERGIILDRFNDLLPAIENIFMDN